MQNSNRTGLDSDKVGLATQVSEVAECMKEYESSEVTELSSLRTLAEGVSAENRQSALAELVKADLERRWRVGLRRPVVDYLREFPELSSLAADLSRLEDEIRRRYATQATEVDVRPASTEETTDLPARPTASSGTKNATAVPDATVILTGSRSTELPVVGAPPRVGRYRVIAEVGSGSFGKVYRCHDEELHRDVAVKLRHSKNSAGAGRVDEFLHEARSAARLRHPNIVAVLDTGRADDDSVYIVYEFVAGQTLKQRMDAGNVPREQLVEWVAEAADALHEAHKSGLVHRDVKPANILIDGSNNTKLTDFGLAKIDDQFFTDDTGRVLGTVAYMSPEQALGQSHWASPQSDIYALGVILYEMLCGRRPFKAESSLDLLEQVKHRTPAPPRTINDDIPKALEDVCLKAIAKAPADRFNTAADMAEALRAAMAPPEPAVVAQPATARSWVGPVIAAGVVAIAALGVWQSGLLSNNNPERTGQPTKAAAIDVSTAPELALFVKRKDELDDGHKWKYLRKDSPPLATGDLVHMHATLDAPAYVYLYWVSANGKLDRLWPVPGKSLTNQRPVNELWYPEGAAAGSSATAKWVRINDKDGLGVEMALLAATETPLSEKDILAFDQRNFALADELSTRRTFAEFFAPMPNRARARGVDQEVVTSAKFVSEDLETVLKTQFRAYHGMVFYHK